MSRPKTLKAFLKIMKRLEATPLEDLKGYHKLDDDERKLLGELVGEIANSINDSSFDSIYKKVKL